MTVQLRVTVGAAYPWSSTARTARLCAPSARPVRLKSLAQVENVPPSMLQRKVPPARAEPKVKLAVRADVSPVGPPVTRVFGAVAEKLSADTVIGALVAEPDR